VSIKDVAAQNASLDNDYGTTRGPNAAASHSLALFDGDPMDVGVEITGPGYARVTVPASDWLASADGAKTLTAPKQFPDATDAWPSVTHWGLYAGAVLWDCAELIESVEVTTASPGPKVSVTVFYDTALNEETP